MIIALGALTNIALAIDHEPELAASVKRIVYMGMGHRMKEAQCDTFPFRPPDEPFQAGYGKKKL